MFYFVTDRKFLEPVGSRNFLHKERAPGRCPGPLCVLFNCTAPPRRHKLRIIRFRVRAKAHSLRCASSPIPSRFARLGMGPRRVVLVAGLGGLPQRA